MVAFSFKVGSVDMGVTPVCLRVGAYPSSTSELPTAHQYVLELVSAPTLSNAS